MTDDDPRWVVRIAWFVVIMAASFSGPFVADKGLPVIIGIPAVFTAGYLAWRLWRRRVTGAW